MISKSKKKRASSLIWEAWQNGHALKDFPEDLAPSNRLEAYQIQMEYAGLSSKPIFGWKIAATSEAGQKHIGVSAPIAGLLLHENTYTSGSKLIFENNRMAVAEPEFAFSMGKRLQPKQGLYTENEVLEAIDKLHLAIELPNSRFEHFEKVGENKLIVDNACAHHFIIGNEVEFNWKETDLAKQKVTISTSRSTKNFGSGANVLRHPITALTWLINELSQNKIPINNKAVVTTGSCTTPIPIKQGDNVVADFGKLGSVSATIE